MVELSPLFSLQDSRQLKSFCSHLCRLAAFCQETYKFLGSVKCSKPKVTYLWADLNVRKLFFKPVYGHNKSDRHGADASRYVSCLRTELNYIMEVHDLISLVEGHEVYITQPRGVMSMPTQDENEALHGLIHRKLQAHRLCSPAPQAPIILYLDLSVIGYSPCKHDLLQQHTDAFIEAVSRAINILDVARVCHMDLRPENIMFKIDDNGHLSIQVIDMESAVKFGDHLPLQDCFKYDKRYPYIDNYFDQGVTVVASEIHNTWFYLALTNWIKSQVEDFGKYMETASDGLKSDLLEELLRVIQL